MSRKNVVILLAMLLLSSFILATPTYAQKTPSGYCVYQDDVFSETHEMSKGVTSVKVTGADKGKLFDIQTTYNKKTRIVKLKMKGKQVGTTKITFEAYKGKKKSYSKSYPFSVIKPNLNVTKRSLYVGQSFYLSMPIAREKVSITNSDKKSIKVERYSNNVFRVKAVKYTKNPVKLKLTLGRNSLTCTINIRPTNAPR